MKKTEYRTYQSFVIFGDPCERTVTGSEDDAEAAALDLAMALAGWLFDVDEWDDAPETGMSNEIDFWWENLSEKPESIESLAGALKNACIIIEPISQE